MPSCPPISLNFRHRGSWPLPFSPARQAILAGASEGLGYCKRRPDDIFRDGFCFRPHFLGGSVLKVSKFLHYIAHGGVTTIFLGGSNDIFLGVFGRVVSDACSPAKPLRPHPSPSVPPPSAPLLSRHPYHARACPRITPDAVGCNAAGRAMVSPATICFFCFYYIFLLFFRVFSFSPSTPKVCP